MRSVTDSVHRLGSSYHNFYVVREGGKATIVDSGATRDFVALEEGLASLALTFNDVEVMVITHAHTDHMGSAQMASQRGVEVKGHEYEIPVLSGARPISQIKSTHPSLLKPTAWSFVVAMLRAGALRAAPIPAVIALSDGETLDVPGRPRHPYPGSHSRSCGLLPGGPTHPVQRRRAGDEEPPRRPGGASVSCPSFPCGSRAGQRLTGSAHWPRHPDGASRPRRSVGRAGGRRGEGGPRNPRWVRWERPRPTTWGRSCHGATTANSAADGR